MRRTRWTTAEENELKRLIGTAWDGDFQGYKDVAEKLNNLFNKNRTEAAVIYKCKVLGI